uniref:SEA domain-containing protein n=1 Tax=Paramormyrops kingsleyae TaxID=1676925 RepID=A0A3B3QII1_9TELE
MVILIIFLVIFLVIVLSLVLYSVVYQDEDEKFDRGSFVVERLYTGTFRLINQNYTEDLHLMKSPQSTELSRYLQKKLGDIYTSSPALGRYFSSVGVKNFSNGSITAHFWLMFHMPQDHTELVQHTLSRSMVQNVLRQSLYEQEFKPWEPLYIDPASSHMAGESLVLSAQADRKPPGQTVHLIMLAFIILDMSQMVNGGKPPLNGSVISGGYIWPPR